MGTLFAFTQQVFAMALVGFFVAIPFTPANIFASPVTEEESRNKHSNAFQAPVSISLGNLNLGVAAYDSRAGIGYIMYTEETVHSRFADTPPSQWNADHLIAVLYINDEWLIDRNEFALEPFTPRPSDRLLVEVDFGANTVSNYVGVDSTINDIRAGYISSDLSVTPETWGGDPDEGEFWIQGTSVTIENIVPTIDIIDGPSNDSTLTTNNPLFAWTATDPDGTIDTYTIDLAGPSASLLTTADTSYQYIDLLNGEYTFCVTAQDNHGESSLEACRSFTIDVPLPNVFPTVQITGGPEEGAIVDIANPLFTWTGEDTDGAIDSFFVSLDGPISDSLATVETSIQLDSLLNGDYSFCVVARDDAGDFSSPACRGFSIDVPPPNELPTVQITDGPVEGSIIDIANPVFAWTGSDTDSIVDSFFVSLDGPVSDSLVTADSTIQYEDLSNGAFTFCVLARDDSGDFSDSACRSFTVDVPIPNALPTVQITNGPADSTTITFNNPAFTWAGEDVDGIINSYIVNLVGPTPDSFATSDTFIQYSGRQNGEYTFCVQAVDDDDDVSETACRFFIIDAPTINEPPTVIIANGPEEGSVLEFNNPAFSWTGEDTDGVIDSFYVELRGPSFTAFSTQDTFHQFAGLLNGDHEFCVRAADDQALFSAWACRPFSVFIPSANVPPTVTIENAPNQGDTLAFNNPAFTWAGEDIDGTVDSFMVDLQGPTPITFATTATFHQFSALDNGSYSFCIQSKDDLEALSEQACRDFVLVVPANNQSPTVSIENGPEDQSVITINNPAFTWAGEDTDGTVESYNIELIGPTALEFNVSDTFYQFPPLSSGSYTFCVQAVDNNGSLSSFVCREFDINSSFGGSLKDVFINKDGAVLQVPMVQQTVGIYQSEVFIASATTDGQGVFSLQGQYGDGSYALRSEFFETIEGIEDPVVIRRTLPIEEDGSLELIVPRTLARDQFEILSNLAEVTVGSDVLEAETESATIGPMYEVDAIDTLLREWLGALGIDIEAQMETMQRISLATAVMERAIGDAAYLGHEQSETLFNMLQVYLTSNEFLSKASTQLTDTGDLNLEDALLIVISHIDDLIYEMAVNTPTQYASAFTPAPYHRSYFDVLVLMYETILKETVFDPGVGTRFSQGFSESSDRNRIKLAANERLLQDVYLPDTQDLIQAIVDLSSQYNTQGTFTEAFGEVLSESSSSLASQSEAIVQLALQQSDSLQENAQSIPAAQQIATLINSQANYAALNNTSLALSTTAFDQSGKALIYTGSGLSDLHMFAHQGALKAFAPDSVFASSSVVAPTGVEITPTQPEGITSADEEAYIAQLDNILWFVEQGNRDVVVTILDDLTELDRQYEASLAALQADLWVAAEQLITSSPGIKSMYENMMVARNESLQHRIQMYVDLLRYAGLRPVNLPTLTAQRDAVAQSMAATGLLSRQIKISLASLDQPFIAITSHQTNTPLITPGTPSEIVVSVQNTGTQVANQLTLTLKADSLFTFLSPPSFIIPTLDPGQETTIRWEFFVQEFVHSRGLYVVEAQLAGEKELFSSGTYAVGIERTVNTSTEGEGGIPREHALHPNFPNPFTSATTIRYDMPEPGHVSLTLYDMVGREVMTLLDASMPAGKHSARLRAQEIPSGTYFLRMAAGEYHHSQSIVVVR